MENSSESFEEVKGRLDEIVEAVSDENISLDDALKLYEEAVQLGLRASSLLEENLQESNALYDEEQNADDANADGDLVDLDGKRDDAGAGSAGQDNEAESIQAVRTSGSDGQSAHFEQA